MPHEMDQAQALKPVAVRKNEGEAIQRSCFGAPNPTHMTSGRVLLI
jgi:hypothetical protein